jgi:acyl-ACP thioesterase
MTPPDPLVATLLESLVPRPAQGRVFEAGRRVRLADASPGGRLRLDACARFLQDIANDDSRDAGTPNPTAWVARRTVMHVIGFPQYLDPLTMATWCSGLGPRWAERRYSVSTADGAARIEAATLWVHIDMATMRPIGLPPGFEHQFGQAAAGRKVGARQRLSTHRPTTAVDESVWPVRFADFDVLGHVNNSVYWAMVEQHLASRRELRAPLLVTLEHHDGIDPDDVVGVVASHDVGCVDIWVTTQSGVAAVASARLLDEGPAG